MPTPIKIAILFLLGATIVFAAIETPKERLNKVKENLKATNIEVVVSPKVSETPSMEIKGKLFTPSEYIQLKSEVIGIIKNRKTKKPTREEALLWIALLNKCGRIELANATDKNLIEKVNNELEKC